MQRLIDASNGRSSTSFNARAARSTVKNAACPSPTPARKTTSAQDRHHRVPYQFCDDCTEEFIDYIERLKGRGDPDCYWRNEAWLEIWSTWINHRAALDRHARSKEFARLLQEIKDITSE